MWKGVGGALPDHPFAVSSWVAEEGAHWLGCRPFSTPPGLDTPLGALGRGVPDPPLPQEGCQALLPRLFILIGLNAAKSVIDQVVHITRVGLGRQA